MFRTILISTFVTLALALMPGEAFAKKDDVYTSWRNNIAVDGYDVTSFHMGRPVEGRRQFSAEYKDAVWYFDTAANRDLFLTNPNAFAPQYGGYCAWAVAKGKLAPGRARHWHVQDGKLYLNYSARVQKRWDALREEFIDDADENWPAILDD